MWTSTNETSNPTRFIGNRHCESLSLQPHAFILGHNQRLGWTDGVGTCKPTLTHMFNLNEVKQKSGSENRLRHLKSHQLLRVRVICQHLQLASHPHSWTVWGSRRTHDEWITSLQRLSRYWTHVFHQVQHSRVLFPHHQILMLWFSKFVECGNCVKAFCSDVTWKLSHLKDEAWDSY